MKIRIAILVLFAFFCSAFLKEDLTAFIFPQHFPAPIYDFTKNPLSQAKVDLGRALFYDPILSRDGSISCASCHSPYNAFAHSDHDLSHGIDDQIGIRNAPTLFNLAWQKTFNWDGAINHLDMQALAPLNDSREMGESTDNVLLKLQSSSLYPRLFEAAFQDSTITGQHFLQALAAFELTLISANSKYDQVKLNRDTFTLQEANGYALFQKNCNSCHQEPLFTRGGFANNGLTVDTTLNDWGKMSITNNPADSLHFKIPTLRNLKYSAPYMHDGRFQKISEVIRHYNTGIQKSKTLASELKNGITLNAKERIDLTAFLLTLTDQEFVFNPKNTFPRDILLKK